MSTRIRKFFFRKYFFADAKIFASTRSVFESFSAVRTYPIVSGNFLICSSAAVKTGSKRMTKAYSKISGYDLPHVYVFVSDKKISTLESVFKNFRIQPENTPDTCGREPYS